MKHGHLTEQRKNFVEAYCRLGNGTLAAKALEGFRADENFMEVMADAYKVGEIVEHFTGRRL